MSLLMVLGVLGVAGALVGCGDDSSTDASPDRRITLDAGPDTGTTVMPDSGGRDGGTTVMPDGRVDSGRVDGGPRPDSGPMGCTTGVSCTAARGCPGGDAPMIPTRSGSICAEEGVDTIMAGGHTWEETSWQDGYCIDHVGNVSTPGACDPNGTIGMNGCPSCGACVTLQNDAMLGTIYGCLTYCALTGSSWMMGNSGCRPGYMCTIGEEVCVPGCSTDDECRATWTDTNTNGMRDMGETTYDATSTATCNHMTYRCQGQPSAASGVAGTPCTADTMCEANGFCISDDPMVMDDWNNGYCTKLGCNLTGLECGGTDAICLDAEIGINTGICLNKCTVGNEMDQFMADNECPAGGYRCVAKGGGPDGGCVPGNYNAVRTPNMGGACTADADCYSPYGGGRCLDINGRGFCTWIGCDWAGLPTDMSGPGMIEDSAVCAGDSYCEQLATDVWACVQHCDPNPAMAGMTGCGMGMSCIATGMAAMGHDGLCFPSCRNDDDCGTGSTCNRTTGICGM